MKTILYILQKEFIQVLRDKSMLPMILFIPIIQLLILSYTATFEIRNIRLVVCDLDHSPESRELGSKFAGSSFYEIIQFATNYDEGLEQLKHGRAEQLLVIEHGFAENLQRYGNASVLLTTDAINGSAASLMNVYGFSIINQFGREKAAAATGGSIIREPLKIEPAFWYNPELDYKTYMVPGILVLLVTIIGMFLSAMNVVREKELGTIEQINVTPIRKYQFMTGKLLPFWIIALFELAFGLILARVVFGISVAGSIPLLFGVAAVYLLVVLGFGLLVSTITDTMQQAMFISWFFMVIFILMSGLFTPVESMPDWAQWINKANPLAYFIKINRMIMLKGSGFSDFSDLFLGLVFYALLTLSLAVWRYRKTV
jgi:ABC-2 type transport system permease protein